MKHTIGQKGFSLLVVLAVLLVLTGLGLGWWYVWEKNKNSHSANNPNNRSQTSNGQDETEESIQTFNCKDIFSPTYPGSLQATRTSADQCLVSNVSIEEMPPVGPLPSEQLGLFFNTEKTDAVSSQEYVDFYVERSQQDASLELKSQEEIELNNGQPATIATMFGGHPVKHDFYFFIYIKNGTAITTSYPINSNYKETAQVILKSIH